MDYYKISSTNRLEFKDLQKNPDDPPQSFFSNVVLIDKTTPALPPILYRLKANSLSPEDVINAFNSKGFHSMEQAEFILIGPIASLDKKNKHITLVDKNFVSYTHLIIASSQRSSPIVEKELSAGMQALLHALNVRNKVPLSFSSSQDTKEFDPPHHVSLYETKRTLQKDIEKVAYPQMHVEDPQNYSQALAATDIIFEVQV